MTITVITQTTEERNQETKDLFEQIRPLLDEGYSYMTACIMIGRADKKLRNHYYSYGWFKDLKAYGKTQGYDYKDYGGKGCKRLPV